MSVDKEIKSLLIYCLEGFKNADGHFLFGLDEIEKHMPELRELHAAKDPHKSAEIADVYIWAKMLVLANDVGEDIILRRISKFREKIRKSRE